MVNGGQASIAISNTSPNLFTVPGDRIDELQKIQFNRLDFTNFYEDLMNNQKIPDSGVLTQKVKEQIADQLKQQDSKVWEITGGNDESHIHVEPFY